MSKTDVIMVIDMSGSMGPLANDVRGGFNEYIRGLKQDNLDARVSVTLFDTEFIPIAINAELDKVPELTEKNYMPRGSTALLDATGKTITNFDSSHKLESDERVLVVIYTDGYENSSREWTRAQINAMIEEREATGQWVFIYLGAARDQWTAEQMTSAGGATIGSTVSTPATPAGVTASFSSLRGATDQYSQGKYKSKEEMVEDLQSQQGNGGSGQTKQTPYPSKGGDASTS